MCYIDCAKQRFISVTQRRVQLNGKKITYTLRVSRYARSIRLEIKQNSILLLTIPRKCNDIWLEKVLREKTGWILKHLDTFDSTVSPTPKKNLGEGDTIPFLGHDLIIQTTSPGADTKIECIKGRITVPSSINSKVTINEKLEEWFRKQAHGIFNNKTAWLSIRLGLTYQRVYVRGQKTRWGSCSRKGNLSLNLKLLMAPEAVIDYVILHELLHLKEMNHSKRFWHLVAQYCPDYKIHRQWLKENEARLLAFFQKNLFKDIDVTGRA